MKAPTLIRLALVLLALPGQATCAETLAERVRTAAGEVRGLEAQYRRSEEKPEQLEALRGILARAAWLEQVGGLQEAREDHLLALARWDALEPHAPVRHGFVEDRSGALRLEALVRRPRDEELPEALRGSGKRLCCLLLRNGTRSGVELAAGPWVELHGGTGESRREEALKGDLLPVALQPFATLFVMPERLAAGEEAQLLVCVPETKEALGALGADVRAAASKESPVSSLRVLFPEADDAAAWNRAQEAAARLETGIQAERERRKKAPSAAAVPEQPKLEPPRPKPGPAIPEALGVVERAGAEEKIQIRLNAPLSVKPGEVLRVRNREKWCGRVKVPEETFLLPDKTVLWVTILEGAREQLVNGTLHRKD